MFDDGHEKFHYSKYGLPRSTTYLIDSGESNHMISSNDLFSTLNLTEGPTIYTGDDSQILAAGRGTIKIQHGELINVLYVPSLAANMLSIYRMTHTVSLKQVVFLPDSMKITNISTGEIKGKGTIDHSSKAYTFSHFMPLSVPTQPQLLFEADKGIQIPLIHIAYTVLLLDISNLDSK